MLSKQCFKCLEVKPLNSFYAHSGMSDGYLNKCKDCSKFDNNLNRKLNKSHYQDYDKKRANLPHRVDARKVYQSTHKTEMGEYKAEWAERNPLKRKAHNIVSKAIRGGRLQKQGCELCGEKAQAHHEDYSKPLEVMWLCSKHHSEHHKKMRQTIF